MIDKTLTLSGLTVRKAIDKCKEMTDTTGKAWYFKANKGVIKLACENNNDLK